MVNETFEKLESKAASIAERVAETARQAGHLAKDARQLKDRAAVALEDQVLAARRAVRQTRRDVEDLRDDVVTTVRRAPLASVGITFAAGLATGMLVGWMSRPRARRS